MSVDSITVLSGVTATIISAIISLIGAIIAVKISTKSAKKINDDSIKAAKELNEQNKLVSNRKEFSHQLLDIKSLVSTYSLDTKAKEKLSNMRMIFDKLLVEQGNGNVVSSDRFHDLKKSFIALEVGLITLLEINERFPNGKASSFTVNRTPEKIKQVNELREAFNNQRDHCEVLIKEFTQISTSVFFELI